MKKVGYIICLIAVIVDVCVSGFHGIRALFLFPPAALLILPIVVLEILAIYNFKKSRGWVAFLLILGVLATVIGFLSDALPILPIILMIGSLIAISDKYFIIS